jgi:DNA-3-methyladenine glycosylase
VRIAQSFFARPVLDVAPELLGCRLIRELGDGSDPASHAHRGPSARNRSMFGPPGHFYVYRSMGLHCCANLVCEPSGTAAAVLLRAVEPLEGEADMARLRGVPPGRGLANGPGKLCRAFDIRLAHDGTTALRGALRIEGPARRDPALRPSEVILAGPRIGIRRAAELPYRYFLAAHACVTRSPLNRRARPFALGATERQRVCSEDRIAWEKST